MFHARLIAVTSIGLFVSASGFAVSDDLKAIVHEDPALGRPVDFERDVYPILEANCVACHNKSLAEGELNLENLESILKGGSNGPAVVAEKADESLIFRLARRGEEPVMPPMPNDRQAKELTPAQLGILRQWITEGAKGPAAGKSKSMNWQPINARLQGVYSLDVDGPGRFIAAGRGNHVSVYDLSRPDGVSTLVDPGIISSATQGPSGAAHLDYVHAIAFHPTEQIIATSGYRNVKLWKRDRTAIGTVIPLPSDQQAWTTSADGTEIFIASAGKGLQAMNAASGAERAVIALDGQAVTAITAFSSQPGWIVAGIADAKVVVVRSSDFQIAHRSESFPAPIVSVSEELDGSRVAVLLADGIVRMAGIAADSGVTSIVTEIKTDAGPIQKIGGQGSALVTIANERTVQIWKTEDGAQLHRFDLPIPVTALDLDSANDRAVFVLNDGQVLLWSLKEAKQIAALSGDLAAQQKLKKSEQNKAVLDSRVAVVKAQIDEAEKEVAAQKEAETKAKAEVEKQTPLQADAKGKYDAAVAATAEARKALEAKADDEALKKAVMEAEKAGAAAKDVFTKADSELSIAKKSLDFATAAIGRAEKRVVERKQQHDAATQEAAAAAAVVEERKGPAAASVTALTARFIGNGRFLATTDATGTVRIWNASTGVAIDVLSGEKVGTAPVAGAQGTSDSVLLQTTDGRIVTRPAFPGWQLSASLGGSENGGESVFVDRVLALTFSPDGSLLAAGGGEASRSGQLTLWNPADGTLVHEFPDAHSDTVYGIEFSADGKLLASAAADKFIKVFDVQSKQFVRAFEGHTHHVMDVAWKSDRTTLASAGADNAIKIWNVETGEQARTISTYSRQVTSIQFVGLQDMIVSSSGDKRVFFHNPANGSPAREFKGNPDYVYRAATNTDGTIVVAGGEDGVVRVWNAADAAELSKFNPPAP